jgi:hypothetical protein
MGSRLPELIDALFSALEPHPGLADVRVVDGPRVEDTPDTDWVVIGYDGDVGSGFEAGQTVGGWSGVGTRREEELQLVVAVLASRGDPEDVRGARQRVYEMAAPIEELLAADPTLGLAEAECAIGASTLIQNQNNRGVQVYLMLQLVARAFT